MSDVLERPRGVELERALAGALHVECAHVDIDAACEAYSESGYEVTPWLRVFLENYSEITVTWSASRGAWANELTTSVESALEAYPGNVRVGLSAFGSRSWA